MRILFFNYEYPPLGGGAANATENLMREFSQFPNLKVDLVTSSPENEYQLEKIGENIQIHKLPIGKNKNNIHFQSQKDLITYSIKALFFARKLKKQNNYALSHSFFTVPCGALSLFFKTFGKIPYIISLRGSDVPGYSDRFSFIYIPLKPIIKLIWEKASFVVANSQDLKKLALKTNKKQSIDIIHNGVDIINFHPKKQKTDDKFRITVGATRITHRKGINYLIDAIKILKNKNITTYIDILGDGNAKEELKEQVKQAGLQKQIRFLGRIPKEKTTPYYQKADIFILPSFNEGMSNALLEALASGLPIVSTNTGGAKKLVNDGENGFIVPMKNSEALAEKIEKIISNKELQEKMSHNSRKLAEKMSWKKVAEKYFDLYRKIRSNQ